jgi:hypothetical protein
MRFIGILAVLIFLCSRTAHAGDLVVIVSDMQSLPAGTVVSGDRPLKIAAGHNVTLISSQGKTFRLSGPYDEVIDASPTQPDGLLNALSRLIAESKNPRTTLAVFRGWSQAVPVGRPDIWGVDITRNGPYCLRPDRPITLWWPTAKSGGNINLGHKAGSQSLVVVWPKGVKAVNWPNALPFVDGGEYAVEFATHRVEVKIIRMPALATNAHRAAWMHDHGCTRQALAVLNALGNGEF